MSNDQVTIKLETYFFFHGGNLCFWKWLPTSRDDALKFLVDSIRYEVYIDVGYSETFVNKPDLSEVGQSNTWIQALKVIVEFNTTSDVKKKVEEHNPPEELLSRIAHFFCILEDSIHDIIRNDLGQFWVSHPYHHPEEDERDILMGLRQRNPVTGKSEQFFYGGTIRLESRIPKEHEMIDKEKWEKLGKLIDRKYRSDLALVCLSNAYSLIREERNYRLALIEAVISLERAVFVHLAQYIPDEEKDKAHPFLNGESVKDAVNNLLPMVSQRLDIDAEAIKLCSDAIDVRNLIIHKTQFRCDQKRIEQYLDGIRFVVRKIVPHQM